MGQSVAMDQLRSETVVAIGIVESALAMARRGTGAVHFKVGRDVVTDADIAIEGFIKETVGDALGLPIVGEESGGLATSEGSYWLVDPICGTRNFASGIALFSVNMALVENGALRIAVVGDGSTGDIHFAEQGRGAWAVTDGNYRQLTVGAESQVVNLGAWPPAGPERERAARFAGDSIRADQWDVRSLSTSLTLAYLAAGRIAADVLFSFQLLHAGAGVLLASESGAILTEVSGQPWTIDSESLVASASQELHDDLIDLLDASGVR